MPGTNGLFQQLIDALTAASRAGGGTQPDGRAGGGAGSQPGGRTPSGAGRRPDPIESLARWSRRALVVLAVVAVVVLLACYWWFHPSLNLRSPLVCLWIVGICLVVILALAVAAARSVLNGQAYKRLMLVPVAVIASIAFGALLSQPFVPGNAERYASVLATADGDFASDIEQVDYADVPVIDRESAVLLGNRAMGSIPEYVSQFEIADTYSQINYQGRPVRVSPLAYADLFKWFSNRDEGIPAYVLVDMVTQEAEVVRLEQPIRYSDSEPLARNVDRHVQLSYPDLMFDQKSFELDEEGHPWWVYPVQRRTIGLFGGTDIYAVVLVDACTGETDFYNVEGVPTWVDRAYPADLLIEQYNWSGAYKNGWLNSWLGQEGVVRTTSGTNGELGYNYLAQGGDIYLYTGVSSVTADSSNVGFILVNQRTGESRYYALAQGGATEDSAMASAEGAVQHLGYQATFPLLLNVAGQPTYFMSLKDAAGLVKMYAMINVESYQSVATGDTVAACQEDYLALLADSGVLAGEAADEAAGREPVSGVVRTVAQAVVDGNSHFYVTLEGVDTIYDCALPELIGVVAWQPGDEVAFTAERPGEDGVAVVTSLDER